jgi:hypothetical protein
MRKKYDYFVNKNKVSRKEFIKELESCCQKVVDTDVVAGWCGIDFVEFDKKKFNRCMRAINNGSGVCFIDAQKSFEREEVKGV